MRYENYEMMNTKEIKRTRKYEASRRRRKNIRSLRRKQMYSVSNVETLRDLWEEDAWIA